MTLQEQRGIIYQEIKLDLNATVQELSSVEAEIAEQRELRDEAKTQGDLSENAAYTSACAEIALLESRKVTTTNRRIALSEAMVQYEPSGFISIGSMVRVQSIDESIDKSFLLTTHELGNAIRNRIAIDSDVGRSIIGKRVGDNFVVRTQAKTIHYVVKEVL